MSPQWLPQNIQKRLLLYVLQQLLLFSEINLPNLEEVSLNNINLKDVSIDPEKVGNLPGCNLRYGQVGTLELKGGIMGGVIVEASNIEIVISPNLSITTDTNISKSVQFLLVQSTQDLANTVILDPSVASNYEDALPPDEDTDDVPPDSASAASPGASKPSALGGVMARAVELALLRLQVRLKDINIKVLSSSDLLIRVDEVALNTINGTRTVKVSGVKVISLNADISGGDDETAVPSKSGESSDKDEENSDEEDDDDDDYDDESSGKDEKSLMDSMVFTHEEASSIYMSATSQSFKDKQIKESHILNDKDIPKLENIIVHIDELDIEFNGLTNITNLFVGINQMSISCSPLIPTVYSIVNGITRSLKLKIHNKKRQQSTNRTSDRSPIYESQSDDYDDDDFDDKDESLEQDDGVDPFFNRCSVNSFILSITSALKPNGELAAPRNNIYIKLNNFNVKQKHDTLTYGGVEVFELVRTIEGEPTELFNFKLNPEDEEPPKADIRFEVFNKLSSVQKVYEYTTLFSKKAEINLDPYSLFHLSDLADSVQSLSNGILSLINTVETYRKLNLYNTQQSIKSNSTNQIILQTASIDITLDLSLNKVNVHLSPVSFNLLEGGLKCKIMTAELEVNGTVNKIGTFSGILLDTKFEEFKTHIISTDFTKELIMGSSLNATIGKVVLDIDFENLMLLLEGFLEFSHKFSTNTKRYTFVPLAQGSVYNLKKPKRRVILPNSKPICDFKISIQKANLSLNNIAPLFGNLLGATHGVVIYKFNGDTNFIVQGFKFERIIETTRQKFIHNYEEKALENMTLPLIVSQLKGNVLEIKLRNIAIEGYAEWQKLFEGRNSSSSPLKSKSQETSATKLDVRFELRDCVLLITPNQLPCKACLVLSKITSDLLVNTMHTHSKTSLRDVVLLLIDDVKELKPAKLITKTPLKFYQSKGYVNIGGINNFHIGVTYNVGGLELVKSQRLSNTYDKLSVLDVKVNLDEVNLEVCGDSFHTLTQMTNDLKLPLILEDKEKFKYKFDNDINIFEDIGDFDFSEGSSNSEPEDISTEDDELQFVDEYYDGNDTFPSSSSATINQVEVKAANLDLDESYFNKLNAKDEVTVNPISINISLSKFNLYSYDGYDWKQTRKAIRGAVKRVEEESLEDNDANNDEGSDDGVEVIEETLFQSIHFTIPKGVNPNHLTTNINHQLNEDNSEIDSNGHKDLQLNRSNKYKISVELKNLDVNMVIFSLRDPIQDPIERDEDFEVLNEIEVVVDLVTIYDNLVDSTWNKYLSYMSQGGIKEVGKNVLRLNICTVRDPLNLNFNETVVKISILPLRLFIDQDTNEFLTRFFKFSDKRFHLEKLEEDVYFKKVEIFNNLKIKIDYKPKKINFIGLKNGEFNELLNLININGLAINLNSIKIYGIKGVDLLFVKLFEHWLPNIQQTQLINLFHGVDALKPFLSISDSFKKLALVPLTDYNDPNFYKKLNTNSKEFLKVTSYELLRLGYKLTNGTQTLLEQGEVALGGKGIKARKYKKKHQKADHSDSDDEISLLENSVRLNKKSIPVDTKNFYSNAKKYGDIEDGPSDSSDEDIDDNKHISLYSNQPAGVKQGVQSGFKSINKNYNLTKEEFLNLVEKVNQSENYEESLKIILKKSPLLLLRPMIGTTEFLLKNLMGLSNEINSAEQQELQDKYKQ